MAVLGGNRPTLTINSYRFLRRMQGKPGGCTTRRKKTEARRWGREYIDTWLEFHLDPESYGFGWQESMPTGHTWADRQRDQLMRREFETAAAKSSFEAWKAQFKNKGFHLLKDFEPMKPRYSSLSNPNPSEAALDAPEELR